MGKSIFFRKQNACALASGFRDDVDAPAAAELVMAQDAVAVDQGVLVRLFVAFVEVSPIAAVVAAHVGHQIVTERQGAGRGDGLPKREAWLHDSVGHSSSLPDRYHLSMAFGGT